jgi:hypothetical protein
MDSGNVYRQQLEEDKEQLAGDSVGGGTRLVKLDYNTVSGFWEGRITPPLLAEFEWKMAIVSWSLPYLMPVDQKWEQDVLWLTLHVPHPVEAHAGQTVDWQWDETGQDVRLTGRAVEPLRWWQLQPMYKDGTYIRASIASYDGAKYETVADGYSGYLELEFTRC